MVVLRVLNKVLGAILLTLCFVPLIALTTISKLLNFIDLLYQNKISQSFLSIIFSPFLALLMVVFATAIFLEQGWGIGLIRLTLTFPTRVSHFFRKQLFFGIKEEESIHNLFMTSDMNVFITSGFFGQSTLKLLSLCLPMEVYLAEDAKTVSPHNDVSIYYTENNLSILIQKYKSIEHENCQAISVQIYDYLCNKLQEIKNIFIEAQALPSTNDTRVGRLQSAQDELNAVEAAIRCLKNFSNTQISDYDLKTQFQSPPKTVLNYIWLAINHECPDKQHQLALKEKLIWTLFQIQRGYNIISDERGVDMPECPSGAIGLLVRVICDEKEKMPGSEYTAADPSPANLTLALKTALDRPFTHSNNVLINLAISDYSRDPRAYKQKQKTSITNAWKNSFVSLLNSGVLKEDQMAEIIDAGIDAWEPPISGI